MIRAIVLFAALALLVGCDDHQPSFPPPAPPEQTAPSTPTVTAQVPIIVLHDARPQPDDATTITLPGGGTMRVPKDQPVEFNRDISGNASGQTLTTTESAAGKSQKMTLSGQQLTAEMVQGAPSAALGAARGLNGVGADAAAAQGSSLSSKMTIKGLPPQQWGGYLLGFVFIIGGAAGWYFFPASNLGKYSILLGVAIIVMSVWVDKYPLLLIGVAVAALLVYLLPHIEAYLQQKKAAAATTTLGTVLQAQQTHESTGGAVSMAAAIQHNTDSTTEDIVNSTIQAVKTKLGIKPVDPIITLTNSLAAAKAAPAQAAAAQASALLGFPQPGTPIPPAAPVGPPVPAGTSVATTPLASVTTTTTYHAPPATPGATT